MKKTIFLVYLLSILGISELFAQGNTGTLKVFSEIQGVSVYVDEGQQTNYQNVILPVGTHYVKVMSGDTKVYGQIVTINKDQVTTVLVENKGTTGTPATTATATATAEPPATQAVETPQVQATPKVGTLNIFSEFTGTSIYLNENKQGDDIKTINDIPVGNHYLKVIKDSVTILAELITINDRQTTTILVKNTPQVQQKMLQSKAKEIQEYKMKKLDVILSQRYVTQTSGTSNSLYFPGYYIATGTTVNNTVSTSTAISDWKIIQGGNKEISESTFASLVGDKNLAASIAAWNKSVEDKNNGFLIAGLCFTLTGLVGAISQLVVPPFLDEGTGLGMAIGGILLGYGCLKVTEVEQKPGHFTTVETASRQAYEYNQALKKKLGLPETFEP